MLKACCFGCARQSKTLKEAVQEYTRRYGRLPPKGFDRWYGWSNGFQSTQGAEDGSPRYKFATDNNVMLIDEVSKTLGRSKRTFCTATDSFHSSMRPQFDQINYDIVPYLALPPDVIRSRIEGLEDLPTSFHIAIIAHDLQMYGTMDEDPRALDVAELMHDFAHLLPDMVMHASGHDTGSILFSDDMRKEAAKLVARGQCE